MTKNLHHLKSEQTRERLLGAAMAILETRGVGQLSVHEVARVADMTTGAVQHHFGSKAALMMEVIIHLVDRLTDGSAFWPAAEWPLQRRAEHFVQQAWEQLYSQPRFAAAWSTYLATRDDPAMTAHIIERRALLGRRLADRMRESFPELRAAPDCDAKVLFVLSCLRGIGLQAPFAHPDTIAPQLRVLSQTLQQFATTPETPP